VFNLHKQRIMTSGKRLVRSQNKLIGGVCAGIAEYLGWDTTMVRLIYLLLVLFAGVGILAYIILWIVMRAN